MVGPLLLETHGVVALPSGFAGTTSGLFVSEALKKKFVVMAKGR